MKEIRGPRRERVKEKEGQGRSHEGIRVAMKKARKEGTGEEMKKWKFGEGERGKDRR